jgi:SET domain-containing protein
MRQVTHPGPSKEHVMSQHPERPDAQGDLSDAIAWTERLVVRPSPRHGLGVFARVAIAADEAIERVPCVPIPRDEMAAARVPGSLTHRYAMPDMPVPGVSAWMLGYGALYNHAAVAAEVNARWEPVDERLLVFVATRAIAAGDEIVYDYGADTGF